MQTAIDIYNEHLGFLQDQYRILEDTLTDEEKSHPVISRKLKRLKYKIIELNGYIQTEEKKLASASQN